jgi:hypothetical protein
VSPLAPEDADRLARVETKLDHLTEILVPIVERVDALDAFRNRVMGAILVLGSGGVLGIVIRFVFPHP